MRTAEEACRASQPGPTPAKRTPARLTLAKSTPAATTRPARSARWRAVGAVPLLLLAHCAAPTSAPVTAPAPPPAAAQPGLERILGQPPQAVVSLLGSPTLERQEGRGRHLQFARLPCVLDVYFYPPRGSPDRPTASGLPAEVVATYAEARQKDGRRMDAGQCLQSQMRVQPIG